jgi:excisionase family DNA binding protein
LIATRSENKFVATKAGRGRRWGQVILDRVRVTFPLHHSTRVPAMASENASLTILITLTVADVATVLGCSRKHVYTMTDAGRMPAPIRIGRLVRWDREVIQRWIQDGCPPVRRTGRAIKR